MATARKTPPRAVASSTPIYELRIELQHLTPAVWRRVLVPASIKLPKLHVTILWSMGWHGGHLHEFVFGQTNYGVPDADFPDDPPLQREDRVTLAKALGSMRTFRYVYDFGDDWEHEIQIEKILSPEPGLRHPRCLDGANACPPEDVGGPPGYMQFLEAISDPQHEDHASMLRWIGGAFNPSAFNLDEVNARLAEINL